MRISTNEVFSDLINTNAPSLSHTIYDPVVQWSRAELLALKRGSILIQIANAGLGCFADEVIALWYKRYQAGDSGDWALITPLPAIGTDVPSDGSDELCALPVGAVYVQANIGCADQVWIKIRQKCGAGSCDDWVPLILTFTRTGDNFSFDPATNIVNLPISGTLTNQGNGDYRWRPDNGTSDFTFSIPLLTDNEDGTFTYDPRDGTTPITINTDSAIVVPADISAVKRAWVEIGNASATNATEVTEADNIYHTGNMVRGAAAFGSTGTVGAELMGNNAMGAGNHVMTSATNCTIGAGNSNENKSTATSFVRGGGDNLATGVGDPATKINMGILAGNLNTVTDALNSVIGGGQSNNITSGQDNVIVGGNNNEIITSGSAAVIVGGNNNKANAIQGQVLGGSFNEANGAASTALGLKAQVAHDYALLINTQPGGNPNTDTDPFNSAAASEFAVRCNGIRFFTNLAESAGMTMAAGASAWVAVSDRRAKNNILPLVVDVLAGYRILQPVSYFMGEQIGAGITAQNFYEAFPFIPEKRIGEFFAVNQAERDGVQDTAIKQLLHVIDELTHRVRSLEDRLAALEGD